MADSNLPRSAGAATAPAAAGTARSSGAGVAHIMQSCSATHCLAVEAATRRVLSWATRRSGNRFGQLGRGKDAALSEAMVDLASAGAGDATAARSPVVVVGVSAGGGKDAGHSAVVTAAGQVLMFGCDRWQQLGLGSPDAGAAGYTWEKGRIWQTTPRPARLGAGDGTIRQAACGADHTVALARDGATVYTWGRGEHGQLGREARMFVGAPARSSALSGGGGGGAGQTIAAVLAVGNCTATCRADGTIIRSVGKCRAVHDELLQAAAAATTPMNER